MNVISLMLHEVRVRRRTILGWTIGLAFFGVMYMAFYPSLPAEMRNLDMGSIDIYKSMGVQSMATFDGYMQSTVFNFLPLLVGMFGIVLGAGALAGDEDAGTLELLAALPISRLQLYFAKAAAVILAAFSVTLAVAVLEAIVFRAIQSQIETSVTALDLFWVVLGHWLIGFVFLSLGLFLGAFLPSRGSALAVAASVLVLTFFGNNLAGMVTALEQVQPLFPFSYFVHVTEMLRGDAPWADILILVAMGLSTLVLAALGFQRRDLTVGAWPWQRPRPGGAPGRSRRPAVVTGVVTVVAIGVVALAAIAYRNDGELRLGWGESDVADESSPTPVASAAIVADESSPTPIAPAVTGGAEDESTPIPVASATASADEPIPTAVASEATSDDRATPTPRSDAAEPTATGAPGGRARATATLRIMP